MSQRPVSDHDLQRLLDADGGEFGAIYRRLNRPEPPRRVDRVVLANAARAVHGGRAPAAQRWMLGLGSAAGIVLAAGIAWQVGKQLESRDAQPAGSAGRSHPSVIAVQPIDQPAASQKAESDAAMREDAVSAASMPAQEQKAVQAARPKAARPASPAAVAPPAPARKVPASSERVAEPERANALSVDAEAEPFPLAKDLPQPPVAPDATDELKDRGSREQAGEATGAAQAKSLSGPEPLQSRAPAPTSSVQLRQNMRLPPEEWLAEIVRLRREGHRQQAIENLRLFRRIHPDWKLSDELLRLAQ